MAADVALVARPSQPISGVSPALSSVVAPSTPMRDQGNCAPTMAQAIPSSTRCLARSRTAAGTSSSVVFATQVASRPVGPAGSVAGRPVAVTAVEALGVISGSPLSFLAAGRWHHCRGPAFVVAYGPDGQDCTSPVFLVAPIPGEWPRGLASAKPIACDATAGSDLDAAAASWTIEAEKDGTALHPSPAGQRRRRRRLDQVRHYSAKPGLDTGLDS